MIMNFCRNCRFIKPAEDTHDANGMGGYHPAYCNYHIINGKWINRINSIYGHIHEFKENKVLKCEIDNRNYDCSYYVKRTWKHFFKDFCK